MLGRVDIESSLQAIERSRYPSGVYSAVPPDSGVIVPIYRSMWIRDTIYTLLAYEAVDDIDRLREGVYALLDRVLLRWRTAWTGASWRECPSMTSSTSTLDTARTGPRSTASCGAFAKTT